jgi:2-iminobutanoate/2-iminopropanoate deaminase
VSTLPLRAAAAVDELVFCSGQTALEDAKLPVSFEAQCRAALVNVESALQSAGCDLGDVVKVNVYLVDMDQFHEMNRIYAETFTDPFPARTCIGVAALPFGALVEFEAVARRTGARKDDR